MSIDQKQAEATSFDENPYVEMLVSQMSHFQKLTKEFVSRHQGPVLLGCFIGGYLVARLKDIWD